MNSHGDGTKRAVGSHNRPSDTPTDFLSNVHFRPSLRGPIQGLSSFIGARSEGDQRRDDGYERAKLEGWGGVAATAFGLDRMRGAGFEPANPYGTGF
jgi:hypothetical protein